MLTTEENRVSGCTLKIIAIISMFIDHITFVLIPPLFSGRFPDLISGHNVISGPFVGLDLEAVYQIGRGLGRLSYPIFIFLLAEGFYHTRNRQKYLFRIFIFALISEIPFDLAFRKSFFDFTYQNVLFTFLLAGLAITLIEFLLRIPSESAFSKVLAIILAFGVAALSIYAGNLLLTDYAGTGVAATLVMYFMGETGNGRVMRREVRNGREDIYEVTTPAFKLRRLLAFTLSVTILGVALNKIEFVALIDILPIALYNGSKGRQRKYFFYIFYPAHLLFLYIVWRLIF